MLLNLDNNIVQALFNKQRCISLINFCACINKTDFDVSSDAFRRAVGSDEGSSHENSNSVFIVSGSEINYIFKYLKRRTFELKKLCRLTFAQEPLHVNMSGGKIVNDKRQTPLVKR